MWIREGVGSSRFAIGMPENGVCNAAMLLKTINAIKAAIIGVTNAGDLCTRFANERKQKTDWQYYFVIPRLFRLADYTL